MENRVLKEGRGFRQEESHSFFPAGSQPSLPGYPLMRSTWGGEVNSRQQEFLDAVAGGSKEALML